ncbi:phosphatase, putative [Talaromyces stipitatus ATCC 10500]|uniref:ADP-ribose 1''-phosphate phosphatase n=1 Tax=Talaromyces stipitatus (strain ATCC 10500 / CBS 375.48 / QM 6759 / NRRL 1006) TaxID=441959 RepID=B8MRZ3_TALSN|nr:phosphatase, putative [Talaromyces stipitatus ATCC 10500]EED13429.1 phosphatase, putative [Talaromyces stipitatus ATCC 10500]
MKTTEITGDLFDAPDGAVLIHACNCLGSWGGGIARVFKHKYPSAYKFYYNHCRALLREKRPHTLLNSQTNDPKIVNLPLGTALIIPPQAQDYSIRQNKKHWIVCLFTSRAYGRGVSKPDVILENSVHAIRDMRRQLEELFEHEDGMEQWDGKVYSCRFNSGLFGVEWKASRKILETELDGMVGVEEVVVVRPKEEIE